MKFYHFQNSSRKLVILLLSLGMAVSATAGQLKVATVNMTQLLNEYYKTREAEAEEKVELEDIKKDDAERLSAIQAMIEELRKLQTEFNDPSFAQAKKKEIAKVANDRQATLAALQREREEFIARRRRALNQKMVGLMDEIRFKVIEAVNAHAASVDVDYVFDESGLTTSQVPFLVYVRNKVDITEDVLKNLNKNAPATSAETPTTESSE